MRYLRFFLLFLLGMSLLTGCNLAEPIAVTATLETIPSIRLAMLPSATPAETPGRALTSLATPTATNPPPTETPRACQIDTSRPRSRYTIQASLDYATKAILVSQNIRYANTTGQLLNEIVLSVEPNQWANIFVLKSATWETANLVTQLVSTKLTLTLPRPLEVGCEADITLQFTINVPKGGAGVSLYHGYFSYGERQMNLAYWLPVVAPNINGAWLIYEPRPIGEQMVLEPADWDVSLEVTNGPSDLQIAAPGTIEQPKPGLWHIIFEHARDFPLSLSNKFRVARQMTASGTMVEMYSFPDSVRSLASGLVDTAQHALDEGARAFQQYNDLFGDYPYDRMVIVQADFPDGMEASGLVFISTNWFYRFEPGFQNYLTVITVHEVSHQWWYASVGNDSAMTPWLDEALATYSEYVYYEEYHPELKNWWWDFRVGEYNPQGSVDSTIYEFDDPRAYINAVYLRGVQMLQNLREDIGTEAFFRLLAEYARTANGQIATPQLFWSLLSPDQFNATSETRKQFFRDSQFGR